jgi:uncharacterized membrane protein
MSLATSGLPICENSSIISLKATEYQVFNAYFKYIFLFSANIKNFVKCKSTVFSNYQLILLLVAFCANIGWFKQFSSH